FFKIFFGLTVVLSLTSAKKEHESEQAPPSAPLTKTFTTLETCEQMALIPSENLRAAGSAIAKTFAEAKSGAAADARNQLAQMMRVVVTNVTEKSQRQSRRTKNIGDEMMNQYVYQSLEATRPIHWSTYNLSDGTVQVYVCMEMVCKSDDFSEELESRVSQEESAESAPAIAPHTTTPAPQQKDIANGKTNAEAEALFEKGRDACRRFNHEAGLPLLLDAVDKGSVNAQSYVGFMYLYGDNVDKDSRLAFRYLLSAANCGHKDAIFQVAEMYNSGTGTEKDKSEAKYWYETARDVGDVRAASRLRYL
ncbi:MAG: tetratricopeptide repeat protein, partial [Rikenellaceae bacterium]